MYVVSFPYITTEMEIRNLHPRPPSTGEMRSDFVFSCDCVAALQYQRFPFLKSSVRDWEQGCQIFLDTYVQFTNMGK
jgi:hypothetical protein